MEKNLGILIEEVGANPIDWTPYQPLGENQYSNNADYMACVSYSFCHCLETMIKYHTGQTVDLSERFLAKVSGTTQQGNTWNNVYQAALKYGVPLQADWDVPLNATWEEFYADIPQEVYDKAKWLINQYDLTSKPVDSSQVSNALSQGPLQVFIELGHPYHAQELVNLTTVFDSYGPPFNKPVKSVNNYFQILLTPKMQTLTAKEVEQLQSLEGFNDPAGVQYWTGKTLDEYLGARLPDKIKTIQSVL